MTSAGIRPTRDVDAIVEVDSYATYAALASRLRALGLAAAVAEQSDLPECVGARPLLAASRMGLEAVDGRGRLSHVQGRKIQLDGCGPNA